MEKSCQSSGDSTVTSGSTASTNTNAATRDQYLKNLNKLSHKISKPIMHKRPPFDPHLHPFNTSTAANATGSNVLNQSQSQANQQQQQQHQPPVYNINKNDFRDVVQKLTGSPAHERYSTPPPIHPPKPQSSRLQRIRPPPLAHVSNRPPPLLNNALPPQPSLVNNSPINHPHSMPLQRPPAAPLSPLPPFPAVHAAAESPVSAYMRYLQNSISSSSAASFDSNPKQFSGFSPLAPLVSPRWNNLAPPQQQFPQPMTALQPLQFQLPSSPLPFGCLNSPRSPHPLLSPGLLVSPSAFPLSPTLPVPSPRWRGL